MEMAPLPKEEIRRLQLAVQCLQTENHLLRNIIETAIGVAYEKDEYDAIDYLINERDNWGLFPKPKNEKK